MVRFATENFRTIWTAIGTSMETTAALETNSVAIEARRDVKTIIAKGGNVARDDSERLLPIECVNPDILEISAMTQPAPKRRRTVHGNFRWTYGQSSNVGLDEVSALILMSLRIWLQLSKAINIHTFSQPKTRWLRRQNEGKNYNAYGQGCVPYSETVESLELVNWFLCLTLFLKMSDCVGNALSQPGMTCGSLRSHNRVSKLNRPMMEFS